MKYRQDFKRFLRLLLIDLAALLILRTVLGLCGCFDAQNTPAKPASAQSSPQVRLPVLMYHSVRGGPEHDYAVTPDTLEADLRYLRDRGCHTVTPEDLVRFVYDGIPLPGKPVMLTFDDGFYNNLCYVLPLLEQYGMCATVNIVGEFSQELAEADSHSPAYSYLTAEDLRQMQQSGRISFGNHTSNLHHRDGRSGCKILPGESEAAYTALLSADLNEVQMFFQKELGISPIVFAYPYGFDCPESKPVLHEMGFLVTMSCYEGMNLLTSDPACLYDLKRYNRAGNQSTEAFFAHIYQ